MRSFRLSLIAAALLVGACSDSNSPLPVISDEQLAADIASAVGDAMANDFNELLQNELFAGLGPAPRASAAGIPGVTVTRSRVCYAANVVQGACDATTTDSIVLTVAMNGSYSRSNPTVHGEETMSAAVHRARTITIRNLFGAEQFRNHNGGGTSADTISFAGTVDGATRSRVMTVAAIDSVDNIVFHLPHASNPWPVSGSLVRNVSGKVTVTGPNAGERLFENRIQVDFPADAQGNVTLDIDGTICLLNLTTRVVSGCE